MLSLLFLPLAQTKEWYLPRSFPSRYISGLLRTPSLQQWLPILYLQPQIFSLVTHPYVHLTNGITSGTFWCISDSTQLESSRISCLPQFTHSTTVIPPLVGSGSVSTTSTISIHPQVQNLFLKHLLITSLTLFSHIHILQNQVSSNFSLKNQTVNIIAFVDHAASSPNYSIPGSLLF